MKYRLLIWFILLGVLAACKDDEQIGFDVPVEFRKPLEFTPMAGGAVMRYYLPDNADIFGVRVRYTNDFGEAILKDGTYLMDSLLLDGFTDERRNVPAQLTFFNRNMEESAAMEVTFDTEKSATMALFDNLTVNPYWGGFNVTYAAPSIVNGLLHVFYIGINPLTQKRDTILKSSTPIMEGGDTLNFTLEQTVSTIDVIVRTDDFSGKRVKQQLFPDIAALEQDTLAHTDFDFDFTGDIVENPTYAIGKEYLMDGDKNGAAYRKNLMAGDAYKYSTFVAGPYAFEERFIIDLREPKVPAFVNLYAFVALNYNWPRKSSAHPFLNELWNGGYETRLPCKIALYGTNEDPKTAELSSCARLYALDYPNESAMFEDSWAVYTSADSEANYEKWNSWSNYTSVSDEDFKKAEPVVLNMPCNYFGKAYRYLFFIVEDTFDSENVYTPENNTLEYVTINELEVCVGKVQNN